MAGYSGFEEWQRTQNQIAALVDELRAIYPNDPRWRFTCPSGGSPSTS